jgi:dolichol-phosphate mannosyltransferase
MGWLSIWLHRFFDHNNLEQEPHLTADEDDISAGKATPQIVAPRLSVVIPTRNEAGNVRELFRAVTAALNGIDHEVIVVDDSTDNTTRPLLAQIGATASHWQVLERARAEQTGLATAVTTGIAMARGDAVCVMDGDLQHPPHVVPKLLQSVEEGADLVIASRYTAGGRSEGFASDYRQMVSHGSRLAAYAVFPEARRTSDPLTGFFCVRRSAIAGLEFRPVGFKILLEILVLCPRLRVVDLPFVFGNRREGKSKASIRQGVLYLRHIASLFLHVPDSSKALKFLLVTILSLSVYEALFEVLAQTGLHLLAAWTVASCGSSLLNAVLQRELTFHHKSHSTLLYRAFGSSGTLAGLAVFALLLVGAPRNPGLTGTLAQGVALTIPLVVNLIGVRRWVHAMTGSGIDLEELARRIDADTAWWSDPTPEPLSVQRQRVAPTGLEELIRRCAESTTPDLVIQSPSERPQPRRNVESLSAIIVPKPHLGLVAVLVRRSVRPLNAADLEEAVRLLHGVASEASGVRLPLTVAKQ